MANDESSGSTESSADDVVTKQQNWLLAYLQKHPVLASAYAVILIAATAATMLAGDKLETGILAVVLALLLGIAATLVSRFLKDDASKSKLPAFATWALLILALLFIVGFGGSWMASRFALGSQPAETDPSKSTEPDGSAVEVGPDFTSEYCVPTTCEKLGRATEEAIRNGQVPTVSITSSISWDELVRRVEEAKAAGPSAFLPRVRISGVRVAADPGQHGSALLLHVSELAMSNGAEIVTNGARVTIRATILTNDGGLIRAFDTPASAPPDQSQVNVPGLDGLDAGMVELTILAKFRGSALSIDLRGRSGGKGGKGTVGSVGPRGPRGSDAVQGVIDCSSSGGDGGRGITGGTGGAGAVGGKGGDGGLLILSGAAAKAESRIQARLEGGAGGAGGDGGDGGPGGGGGDGGSGSFSCDGGRGGPTGFVGQPGLAGPVGATGASGRVRN